MRIASLRLLAYGPFEDRELDFSVRPEALTIVFGRNEAGKSTSLRALEGLLFGIDSTQDAHRHAPASLRVGGTIVSSKGEELRFIRRRGRKGTLRDDTDQVIDDEPLRRLLRGVDRELFRTLYGLDHLRLREGAKALLSERSSFSESLFEAGIAGAGVARLLSSLRDQAEEIFVPLGKKRPLNEALRLFGEAKKNAREYATAPSKYEGQVAAIQDAEQRRAKAEEELRAIERAHRRLDRGRRVAPILAAHREARRHREALHGVVLLPKSARADRERALLEREVAETSLRALDIRMDEIRLADAADAAVKIEVDPDEGIETLSQLTAACRDDRRRRELLDERVATQSRLATLGHPKEAVLDLDQEPILLRAVTARDAAEAPVVRAEVEVAELEASIGVLEETLTRTERGDIGAVERIAVATVPAQRALARSDDLEEARRRLGALEPAASRAFIEVGSSLSRPELAKAVGPALEDVDDGSRAHSEAMAEVRATGERLRELEQERADLCRERASLLQHGDVATVIDLESLRVARDVTLAKLIRSPTDDMLAETLVAVRRVDSMADRMRSEAGQRANLERIDTAIAHHVSAIARVEERRRGVTRRATEIAENAAKKMVALGGPSEIDPRAHVAFVQRWRAFVDAETVAVRAASTVSSLEDEQSRVTASLAAALGGPGSGLSLPALVALAERDLTEHQRRVTERERCGAKLEEARIALAKARARLDGARVVRDAARDIATGALQSAGLDRGADKDAVVSAFRRAHEAAEATARLSRIDAQLARADDDERRLASYSDTLTRAIGREPRDGDPLARAEVLLDELRRAKTARDDARERDLRRTEIEERRREALERRAAADAVLAAHLAQANVATLAELPDAEERSARALELDEDIVQLHAQIRAAGDGATLDELELEYAAFDLDAAEAESERLEAEKEELERAKDRAAHDRANFDFALRRFEESTAAEAAEQAQLHLARARSLAIHYTKLRLASVVLEREIEAYRRLHQAPVLARAEEHFCRLTKDSFRELRVVLDERDQPELVCVRAGQEVPIDGLSDGAKDQLFLALRLATIERHTENVESLPLVLDDILVNFDEDRSRAALEVLASLCPKMQVLLFTHHERVAELAQEAAGARVVAL